MDKTRIIVAEGTYDLSNIKSQQDLKEEIALLKTAIRNDERLLQLHLRRAPQEALKSTADAVLPSFINKMIANGTWKVLASSASMLVNPFSKKYSFGKNVLGSAKKLGLLTVIKGAYSLWRNKNADAPKSKLKDKSVTTKVTRSTVPVRPIK